MFFLNSPAFSMIQKILAIWSLDPIFSKSRLNIWKVSIHLLLKPHLENFEHCFASMWDECNRAVVGTFFGIAFLWDWNENWPLPVLRPLLSFLNLLAYWGQHFHGIIFRIWNSSTGIPSPPLALFVVMAHLTSHSRMCGSRWVIAPSWLSGSWRSFLYRSSVYFCFIDYSKAFDCVDHNKLWKLFKEVEYRPSVMVKSECRSRSNS